MKETFESNEPISGAFIKAQQVKRRALTESVFSIKLSAITLIQENSDSSCLIWTYKDCCYFVELSEQELKRAINSFLFDSENHYTNYI